MKNPPVLIAVIGFFAALAGFGYLFFGLRLLGFDWFGALGDLPAVRERSDSGAGSPSPPGSSGCSWPRWVSGPSSRGLDSSR